MWMFYIFCAYMVFIAIVELINRIRKVIDVKEKKRVENLAKEIEEKETTLKNERELIEQMETTLKNEREHFEKIKAESVVALERISEEKALGFPWLASAYSEYHKLYDLKLANELEHK